MKHPIGFCVQPKAPEAASPTPAAQPEAAAVPSVVRVYFPERDRAYSYYNDRFDLHEGEYVYQDLIRAIDAQMTPAMLEDICRGCAWYPVSACKKNICGK